MSRTEVGGSGEADHPLDIGRKVAGRRVEAERRAGVRRRRRQILPAVVAGSATLAVVGVAGSWVAPRLPAPPPVAVLTPADPSASAAQARVDALENELTADEQALQALSTETAAAGKGDPAGRAVPGPPPPGSARPVAPGAALGGRAQTFASAPAAAAKAPAVHATTGASHAH